MRERSFKYLDAQQESQQISVFFKSKFHNEGGVCEKSYFEVFFWQWSHLSFPKISTFTDPPFTFLAYISIAMLQIFWSWQVTYLLYSVCLLLPFSGPSCLSISFHLSLTMFSSLSLATDFVKIDVFQQIDDSVLYRFPHLLTRFICPLMVLAYYVKQAGHVCWVVEKAQK